MTFPQDILERHSMPLGRAARFRPGNAIRSGVAGTLLSPVRLQGWPHALGPACIAEPRSLPKQLSHQGRGC